MVDIDIHSLTFKVGRFLEQGVVVVIRADESFFTFYWGFSVLWFAPTYFVLGVECVSSEPVLWVESINFREECLDFCDDICSWHSILIKFIKDYSRGQRIIGFGNFFFFF